MSDGMVHEDVYLRARLEEWLDRQARTLHVSRRRLLELLAGTSAGALLAACVPPGTPPPTPTAPATGGAAGRPTTIPTTSVDNPHVKPTPADLFINHGVNREMRWERMAGRGYTTPNELFFIRDHTKTPVIDPATWRLTIKGSGVERETQLTLDDLLRLPQTTVTKYVECAGNGRSFFESIGGKRASGTSWKLGAIGVAEFRGPRLRDVLDRAGLKRTARDVMPEGLDDQRVRRPMSIEKATDADTIVALQMNGQPLPHDHGFPARVLVPGWIGVASIKWVGSIEVSETALFSPWNTDSYVMIGPDYRPEPPAKGPALSTQNVKSALELAWPAQLRAGQQTIRGRAWSGVGTISQVEFSLDGREWQRATLVAGPNGYGQWALFEFSWNAQPGQYQLRVRATDDKGNLQPPTVPFNEQGYLYNGIVGHPVTVS
jgi:sulfane dehydrogenase subunit SoxC